MEFPGSIVYDPWNGSGTTTFAAASLGLGSVGLDLNPAMVVVAKARLLPTSEADTLLPLGKKIVELASTHAETIESDDPLHTWFGRGNARTIRSIERSIQSHLVGSLTQTSQELHLENLSSLAAANLVALFSVSRKLARKFRTTNPTWMRPPRADETKPRFNNATIYASFLENLRAMTDALHARSKIAEHEIARHKIMLGDSTTAKSTSGRIDLVLTSPPYCTRIDYTAATRIELAILHPLTQLKVGELSRQMIGSVRVPMEDIEVDQAWGDTCVTFLENLRNHPSKASDGYYYRTHLDYFQKMKLSIENLSHALREDALAILVVQDSYYKELYNDLPAIITEIAKRQGLSLKRRENFVISRTMAGLHPYSRNYEKPFGALEAVLCFQKSGASDGGSQQWTGN